LLGLARERAVDGHIDPDQPQPSAVLQIERRTIGDIAEFRRAAGRESRFERGLRRGRGRDRGKQQRESRAAHRFQTSKRSTIAPSGAKQAAISGPP
jgi:hypothetical protein